MSIPKTINRVAFVHYNIGGVDGVRTVIRNSIAGLYLQGIRRFHLIGGKGSVTSAGFRSLEQTYPGLRIKYSEVDHLNCAKEDGLNEKARVIRNQLTALTQKDDLVVVENPLHGLFIAAMIGIRDFAEAAISSKNVLFRVHDFAEDREYVFYRLMRHFTPAEIQHYLYPENINVAVINPEYQNRFRAVTRAGNVSVLPNSILPVDDIWQNKAEVKISLGLPADANLVIYPVRTIPRKVIEEAILLTHIMNSIIDSTDKRPTLVVPKAHGTRKDLYPEELMGAVNDCGLKSQVKFIQATDPERCVSRSGKLIRPSIYDVMAASNSVLTTSMQEGFGLAFLEPFCVGGGQPVLGRRLRTAADFENAGIDYCGMLYDRFNVQGKDFILQLSPSSRIALLAKTLKFRMLDGVIKENSALLTRYRDFFMSSPELIEEYRKAIASNRQIIKKQYSVEEMARLLLAIVGVSA